MSPLAVAGLPAPAEAAVLTTTAVTPVPPDGERNLQPTDVTPGVLGFAVMFGVALLVIVIALAMTRSLRRVSYRRGPADEGTGPGGADGAPDGSRGPGRPGGRGGEPQA